MVEVLVDPAPTGDDEPAEADNAPDLTPLFDALDSYDESPSADMPDVDRAVDALVDAVRALRESERRDGTYPTVEEVHEWLFQSQLVEDATEMVWDGLDDDEVDRIRDVLAAVRALRDEGAR